VLREREILERPELLSQAAVFGVDRRGSERPDPWDDPRLPDPYAEQDEEQQGAEASLSAAVPASLPAPETPPDEPVVRRRPGRPRGSKNKARKESTATSTKRRRRS
jgi:hypothetical protein